MNQREKLIELLGGELRFAFFSPLALGTIADNLIANGVVVLPCRCAECKHARKLKYDFREWDFSCKYFNSHSVRSNDFCSYAKRKGGDERE